jgi:hypothetical protein
LFERSHTVKATPTITPNPIPEQFTQGPKQAETTNTRKTAKTNMSAPKPTAALKLAPVTTKWQVAKTAKSKVEDPKSANEVVPPHPNQSLLEGISDLLDKLPLDTCVELTCQLLTTAPTLPTGRAHPQAVLKTVIHFVAEYGSVAYLDRQEESPVPCLLECGWNPREEA